MYYGIVIIFTILELVLQISVLPQLGVQNVFPHLILVTIVLWIMLMDFEFAVWFSLATGLFLDLFSATFIGSHVLAFLAVLFILRLISDVYFPRDAYVSALFLAGAGSLIFYVVLTLLNLFVDFVGLTDYPFSFFDFFVLQLPIGIAWSLILVTLLWKFFQKFTDVLLYFQHRVRNS